MTPLAAGAFNRRIQIQALTKAPEFSKESDKWNTILECWANIDIQNSQLLYSTAEFISSVTYRITCRWVATPVITTAHRILFADPSSGTTHTYTIQAVWDDQAANKQLIIMTHELAGTT